MVSCKKWIGGSGKVKVELRLQREFAKCHPTNKCHRCSNWDCVKVRNGEGVKSIFHQDGVKNGSAGGGNSSIFKAFSEIVVRYQGLFYAFLKRMSWYGVLQKVYIYKNLWINLIKVKGKTLIIITIIAHHEG